jgi:gliding motility-associated-like protein
LATVSGDILTGVSRGNVQIRAYNAGDQNYTAAEAMATVEIYSTHKDVMHLFTPNNDGINDQWELPELAAWGKCDVKVYNRWGQLVFADKDYHNQWEGISKGSQLPEGAYYFIVITENAGEVKGTVNVVR